MSDQMRNPARSFSRVAEAYDRARPSYPGEAADWLVGPVGNGGLQVLELGAGTGKFTELLVARGHRVTAIDPSPEMLGFLQARVPAAQTMVATAEHLPVPSRSIDVVVSAQAFHWFDHGPALAEIARVLKPGGTLGLVWNARDEGIPWVRRLGAMIGGEGRTDLVEPVRECEYFDDVAEREYRFWQDLGRDELFDLVRSRSYVAVLDDPERDEVLARVGALYDDYGRGPDGMKLPYLTRCYKTTVVSQPPPPVVMSRIEDEVINLTDDGLEATQSMPRPAAASVSPGLPAARPTATGPEDTGTLLIDFH